MILIVVFDLDLFQSIGPFLYGGSVHVSISSAKLFFNLDIFKAIVTFHDSMVGKKIKHPIINYKLIISNETSLTLPDNSIVT